MCETPCVKQQLSYLTFKTTKVWGAISVETQCLYLKIHFTIYYCAMHFTKPVPAFSKIVVQINVPTLLQTIANFNFVELWLVLWTLI